MLANIGTERIRIAFIAGSLCLGGAEKQLFYMVKACEEKGIDIRVYSTTRGEYFGDKLRQLGVHPIWFGQYKNPILRIIKLSSYMRRFNPQIIQSTIFHSNLYATIAGNINDAIVLGSLRNDTNFELDQLGFWGPWLLRLPRYLLANSYAAQRKAESLGVLSKKIFVLHNVIDLKDFDQRSRYNKSFDIMTGRIGVFAIARLVQHKRLDYFISALAMARSEVSNLKGIIIGDGPERGRLEDQAQQLGLIPDGLQFLGQQADVPGIIKNADILVLTSDYEGFPNVLLEGMAAEIPVVATPAGDVGIVLQEGKTGYLVPHGDIRDLARLIILLAKDTDLRRMLGKGGRERVEELFRFDLLGDRLLTIYRLLLTEKGNLSQVDCKEQNILT